MDFLEVSCIPQRRWALERGFVVENDAGKMSTELASSSILSSAMMNFGLGSESFRNDGLPSEWRKVFWFELDKDDVDLLQEISAPSWKVVLPL